MKNNQNKKSIIFVKPSANCYELKLAQDLDLYIETIPHIQDLFRLLSDVEFNKSCI